VGSRISLRAGRSLCRDIKEERWRKESETTAKIIFGASPLALVPRYWEREREIENAEPKPPRPTVAPAKDAEVWRNYYTAERERNERVKARKNELTGGFDFCDYRAGMSPRLGELDELIAAAQAGTTSEGEEASGEFAPATRSDSLSDDWRERLPSLLEYRLDRCNALFQAAKVLYVDILGTKVRGMKGVGVWVSPDGCGLETGMGPGAPAWLKIGALTEFYEKKRGVYWGSSVKKRNKISYKDDARQWLAREIGRRLEAALQAEK